MKSLRPHPLVLIPCVVALLAVSATAAPLDPAHVPSGAKWIIHVDLKALSQTQLADRIRENQQQLVTAIRKNLERRFGIDPRQDLDSLTMFGDSYEPHTGTAILKADYDQQKVQAGLEQRPNVQRETWNGLTLYRLQHDDASGAASANSSAQERSSTSEIRSYDQSNGKSKRSMTVVLLDPKTAIFASSDEQAKAAVAMCQNQSTSSASKDSPLLAKLSDGAIFYGAAHDLQQIKQRDGVFPILSQHDKAYWTIGSKDKEVFQELSLTATSEEVAKDMQKVLEGATSFCKVWAYDSQSLKKVIDNRDITRDGKTVELKGRSDSDTVLTALGDIKDRFLTMANDSN